MKDFDLKCLDKRDARLALRVYNFCRKDLGMDLRGKALVLAVSGGADSTALLILFRALRDYLGLRLSVAHLDHSLRPGSADEALAVQALGARFELPVFCRRLPVAELAAQKNIGLEEAGRTARYDFFEQVRVENAADWILTAHHLDDLAEDVLLRLIRGAGWPALGGMPAVRGTILRPLLLTEKRELLDLLLRQNIPWQEDESNLGRDFRRNRVRLDIMPLLLEENPGFLRNIRHMWEMAAQERDYWQFLWREKSHARDGEVFFARPDLLGLHKAARLKLYTLSLKEIGRGQALSANLQALDEAFCGGSKKIIQLPGSVTAYTDQSGVSFSLNANGE